MKTVLNFLRQLRENNNREWFAANKPTYLAAQAKFNDFAESMIAAVASIDTEAAKLTLKDCTYRIYRDTRFSPDKTPYKQHMGVFINPPFGKKINTAGYYVHIEPDNCFVCGGTVCLENHIIKAIRQSIYNNIEEYRAIVEDAEFKKYLPVLGENYLKTAPKGFDKNWEFIDYIRPKDYVAVGTLEESFFDEQSTIVDRLMPYLIQAKRFDDFLNYTIEDFLLPDNSDKEEIPYIY